MLRVPNTFVHTLTLLRAIVNTLLCIRKRFHVPPLQQTVPFISDTPQRCYFLQGCSMKACMRSARAGFLALPQIA